ncbi:hypothetical protein J6590_051726 [Homalodisca vitripennis]|nr:hypothetical protein J6590_051726 [Homalodisca vitripennis]
MFDLMKLKKNTSFNFSTQPTLDSLGETYSKQSITWLQTLPNAANIVHALKSGGKEVLCRSGWLHCHYEDSVPVPRLFLARMPVVLRA